MWLTLIINLIKNNWRLAAGLLGLLCIFFAFWYTHHQGYLEGEATVQRTFDLYKAQQATLAAEAEHEKQLTEARHEQDTLAIASSYSTQLDDLNKRLLELDVSAVPRGADLCVASQEHPASGVPETSPAPGRVDATFALKPHIKIDTDDAIRDTLQCTKLQEWVRDVCAK